MRRTLIALAGTVVTTCFLAGTAPAADPHSHEGEITAYEGAKTCLECHDKAGQEVAASLHYQQQGPAPFLEGQPAGKPAGMMVSF